jgi:hypothetical protein
MFDYGPNKNILKYGKEVPMDYNLTAATTPVFLHYSDHDWLVATEDILELKKSLGNVVDMFAVEGKKFNHLDFLYARNADRLIYNRTLETLKKY